MYFEIHSCRVVSRQNPYEVLEDERNSLKLNVWYGIITNKTVGLFPSLKKVTGAIYQDILERFFIPQLQAIPTKIILQQDGTPPHWYFDVRDSLDEHFS